MFVRLTFDSGQRITSEEAVDLSKVLGDEVDCSELVKDDSDKLTTFSTYYRHTFDPEEVRLSLNEEKPKVLVTKTNMVELGYSKEYLTDLDLFLTKFPSLKIKIRGMVQTSESSSLNMVNRMIEVQSKLEAALQSFDEKVEFNQKCNVHISNLGLLAINQLAFATDKCTEELQELLNSGWRLLAICPQPDQRRPDYILGKSNPEESEGQVRCHKF